MLRSPLFVSAAQEVERLNQTEDVEGFGRDGAGGNPKELAKRLHLVAAKYKTERERSHKIEVRLRQIKARVCNLKDVA